MNIRPSTGQYYQFMAALQNILLSGQMLGSVVHDDESKVYVDVIMRNAVRIEHLINTFPIRINAEELRLERDSMYQILNEVLEIAGETVTRKRVVVSKEYAAPDHQLGYKYQAMKIALTIIFMHTLGNMEQGKGQLTLKTKLIDDKFVLRIEGNGALSNERHLLVDSAGLGLPTAFYILRSNYINIEVEPERDRGTNFTLMIKGPLFPRENNADGKETVFIE